MAYMKTVSALDVRKHFGALLDEAAAGEHIVIERAGHPVAALVPLRDLYEVTPETRRRRRLEAIDEMQRLAREYPIDIPDPVALVRQMREDRLQQITRNIEQARKERP